MELTTINPVYVFTQDNTPTDLTEGKIWVDTSTDPPITKVSDGTTYNSIGASVDGITIGLNESSELEVKDASITNNKINTSVLPLIYFNAAEYSQINGTYVDKFSIASNYDKYINYISANMKSSDSGTSNCRFTFTYADDTTDTLVLTTNSISYLNIYGQNPVPNKKIKSIVVALSGQAGSTTGYTKDITWSAI